MLTQKQINDYIPGSIETFKGIMPPISVQYPKIRIASEKTLEDIRNELLDFSGSKNTNHPIPYTSSMETLHGEGGTGILIYQKYCPEMIYHFNHCLWHELGHFYSYVTDKNDFYHLGEQSLNENSIRQHGYWVWGEFVAESISNYIIEQFYPVHIADVTANWRVVYNYIQSIIQNAYKANLYSFSEYALAIYFSTVLMNPSAKEFIKLCSEKKLKVKDPYAISCLPEQYQEIIHDILILLQNKVKEKEFWSVDGEFLDKLGFMINELNGIKTIRAVRGLE